MLVNVSVIGCHLVGVHGVHIVLQSSWNVSSVAGLGFRRATSGGTKLRWRGESVMEIRDLTRQLWEFTMHMYVYIYMLYT